MDMYIFGYGSLMNLESLRRTLPREHSTIPAILRGYQRKMNAPGKGYVYLNLIQNKDMSVRGVLIPITSEELELLKEREYGYSFVEVSHQLAMPRDTDLPVYAFIAPDDRHHEHKVLRSYLLTCLTALPHEEREAWIQETIIENEIEEDAGDTQEENA